MSHKAELLRDLQKMGERHCKRSKQKVASNWLHCIHRGPDGMNEKLRMQHQVGRL